MKYKLILSNINEDNWISNDYVTHICSCNEEWLKVGKIITFLTEINTERRLEIYSITVPGDDVYSCPADYFDGKNQCPKIVAFECVGSDTWIKRLVVIEKID